MILNHLWGLYSHPNDEFQAINNARESFIYSLSHILITALVPTICCFFSAVYLGWYLSLEATSKLPLLKALGGALLIYAVLVIGVFLFALLIWQLARLFAANTTFLHAVELSAYAATPLLMTGFGALYPQPWFIITVAIGGLGYSVYLLFSGVPILIDIAPIKRRTYTLSLVACGLILIFSLLGTMIWVWQ